jgi:hypothetical protein
MLSQPFRDAVEAREVAGARDLFREDVVFRSPVVFKPYRGRDQVLAVLSAAERVLAGGSQFRYVHQLEDPQECVAMLEFETEVDGKRVEGIDKLSFDKDGLITELKVLLRPASAIAAVASRMAVEFERDGLQPPG